MRWVTKLWRLCRARHRRHALHLLQSGVDIAVIALWLGHENIQTTHGYIEADLPIKLRSKPFRKWFLQAKPQRDLNPTTRCWHSLLHSNKNKMRSEFPSNAVPEYIQPTHSAFYRTRHLERIRY